MPLCYCCLFVCHVSVCSKTHQMARADTSSVISPAPLPVYVWTNVLVSMPWHSCIYAPPRLEQLWCSFGSTSGSGLIREPLDWRTQNRPWRAGKEGGKAGGACSRSETRANSHIITFPAAIFQLARYRSARELLDALCFSLTGLGATFCPSSVEISPHSGGGQASLPGKASRHAGTAYSWIWLRCAFHVLLPVFMVKGEQTSFFFDRKGKWGECHIGIIGKYVF